MSITAVFIRSSWMRRCIAVATALAAVGLVQAVGLGTAVAVTPSICDGVAGNLVHDCGFESPLSAANWTLTPAAGGNAGIGVSGDAANSGSGVFSFCSHTTDDTISEPIQGTTQQHWYQVRYTLANVQTAAPPSNHFTATVGPSLSAPLFVMSDQTNASASPYTISSKFNFRASASTPVLTFAGSNLNGCWDLDDITVVDLTTPSQCDAVVGNLVTNCGFEQNTRPTVTPTGWSFTASASGTTSGVDLQPVQPHSGSHEYVFEANSPDGAAANDDTISQTIAGTTTGVTYDVSFWLQHASSSAAEGGLGGDFTAAVQNASGGTVTIVSGHFANGLPYSQYHASFVAGATAPTVTFSGADSASFFLLDDVVVTPVAPPTIAASFNPSTIEVNATSSETFTIANPNSARSLSGVGFSDTLPAGVTVPNASATICGGTATVTAPSTVVLAGATVAAGSQCVFSVTVTGTTAGVKVNTTSAVTSNEGGSGGTATATLTVDSPAPPPGPPPAPTITVSSSKNPAGTGDPLTFTATVSPAPSCGSVSWLIDNAATSAGAKGSGGTYTLGPVPGLAVGMHPVTAVYSGCASAGPASGTVEEEVDANPPSSPSPTPTPTTSVQNPTITAHVAGHQGRRGWFTGSVTVTFTCAAGSSPLSSPCPDPVTLSHSGKAQTVTRSVSDTDGGAASASVTVDIDTGSPTLVVHPRRGMCVGSDPVSGVASCVVTRHGTTNHGVTTVHWTAVATDNAGNQATKTGVYSVNKG